MVPPEIIQHHHHILRWLANDPSTQAGSARQAIAEFGHKQGERMMAGGVFNWQLWLQWLLAVLGNLPPLPGQGPAPAFTQGVPQEAPPGMPGFAEATAPKPMVKMQPVGPVPKHEEEEEKAPAKHSKDEEKHAKHK